MSDPPAEGPAATETRTIPALAALEAGDAAWWAGERGDARRRWREALRVADDAPTGLAVEAMARIRLLRVSGNLAPFVHEGPLNRALAACPEREPWCAIAWADWDLHMPAFVGADPHRVPGRLAGNPLPEAAARVAVAESGARPDDPGTWVFALGLSGAPAAGVGATVRFVHPDVAWHRHRLDLSASIDSLGGAGIAASATTATRPALQAAAGVSRTVGIVWEGDVPDRYQLDLARLSAGVAWKVGAAAFQLGGTSRWEDAGAGPGWEKGPYAAFTVTSGRVSARASADATVGSYAHLLLGVDLRAYPALAGGTLALRASGAAAPLRDSPFWRLPEAGGSTLLRGAPTGRWRDATLGACQVEYRHPVVGPLEAVGFVDTAHVDGWHATAGAGVRIVLPPDRLNVTRLDVGVGPTSWGIVVGWGEAF